MNKEINTDEEAVIKELFDFKKEETEEEPAIENEKEDDGFEEFLEEEMKKENIIALEKRSKEFPKNYPTFLQIMRFKFENPRITLVEFSDIVEDMLHEIKPEMYVIRPMPFTKYNQFITENNGIIGNTREYYLYLMKESILFPETNDKKLEVLAAGIVNTLIEQISLISKFETKSTIERL